MLFDGSNIARKTATRGLLPPVPVTDWVRMTSPPRLDSAVRLAFDVETYDPSLTTMGSGWGRNDGRIVGVAIGAQDAAGNLGSWYFPTSHAVFAEDNLPEKPVFEWLKGILETPVEKVGANLTYDIGWLGEYNIKPAGPLHDVQFAEALLDNDALVALEVLSQKYLGFGKDTKLLYDWLKTAYPYQTDSKLRGDIYRAPASLVGKYAQSDVINPLLILQKQIPLLEAENLTTVYRLECELIPMMVAMRKRGVRVDVDRALKMVAELNAESQQEAKALGDEYGLNIAGVASSQISKLFDAANVRYPKTDLGNPSITGPWLKSLEHPLGEQIISIREKEKIASTFLRGYIIEKNVNKRLHPNFHQLHADENGTKVGRLSSSQPNLQNLPSRTKLGKRVRECFLPDEGHHSWIKLDFSQIHYRILAHNAVGQGANELRQKYIDNPKTDYHMEVYSAAAPMLGWSLTDQAEIKEKRRPIKNVNFGLLYGQSEKSLGYKNGFTKEQAVEFMKIYHKAAPYVKPTMRAIANEVQDFGYVTTLLGRRIRFPLFEPEARDFENYSQPLPYEAALREYGAPLKRAYDYRGVNYKFQGSEPDIMKASMLALWRSGVFDVTGVPMITVHDECDYSKRDNSDLTNQAFAFVKHTMETTIKMRVPIYADMSEGPNWGKAD